MTRRRRPLWLLIAAAVVTAESFVLYTAFHVAGIAIAVGSGAVAVIVMAHLGVLAALLAPLAILRHRSQGRKM